REHAVAHTGPGHRPDLAAVAGVGLAHPDVVVTVADTHTADDDQIAVGRDRDTRADVVAIHDLHRAGHDLLPDDRAIGCGQLGVPDVVALASRATAHVDLTAGSEREADERVAAHAAVVHRFPRERAVGVPLGDPAVVVVASRHHTGGVDAAVVGEHDIVGPERRG